jgi:hypothetical protein
MKFGGMLAVVCFLFFPVAGCGSMSVSGVDLIQMNDFSTSVKILIVLSMLCGIGIIFLKDKTSVFLSSLWGILSLIIAYTIAKWKMSSKDDFGMSEFIELKSGSYFSILGFIISGIFSKIENEIFPDQSPLETSIINDEDNKIVPLTNTPLTDLNYEKRIIEELHEKGVLNSEEYESKIKEINKIENDTTFNNILSAETKILIDKINELKNSGLLTEEEFKVKHSEIIKNNLK